MSKRFRGLTPNQEKVFEQVATGNSLGHHPATLKTLEEKGYIQSYQEVMGKDAFGLIIVTKWQVPIPLHIEWCEWCADNYVEVDDVELDDDQKGSEG